MAAKIKTVHVPYKSTAPGFTALLGGEVQFAISTVVTGLQHVKAGRLKVIATTMKTRVAMLPDVAAANETLPGAAAGAKMPEYSRFEIADRFSRTRYS